MHKDMQILIVASDSEVVANIATEIVTRLSANVSIVDLVEEAGPLLASGAFDLIVTEPQLRDGNGLGLVRNGAAPAIVISSGHETSEVVEAFRAGADDVVTVPADGEQLAASIERLVEQYRTEQRQAGRSRRLRTLSKELNKNRRELRRRVDLICRDLVHAYQRLAEKFVAAGTERRDFRRIDSSPLDESI